MHGTMNIKTAIGRVGLGLLTFRPEVFGVSKLFLKIYHLEK